jgi:hypothetical protein
MKRTNDLIENMIKVIAAGIQIAQLLCFLFIISPVNSLLAPLTIGKLGDPYHHLNIECDTKVTALDAFQIDCDFKSNISCEQPPRSYYLIGG